MKKLIAKYALFFCSILPTFLAYAQIVPIAGISAGGTGGGLGDAAEALAGDPIYYMLKAFYAACYLGGFVLIYKGHAGFKAHRSNPHFAGALMPSILIILGIIMLCIPTIHHLTGTDSLI